MSVVVDTVNNHESDHVMYWSPEVPAAELYFDLNGNHVIDSADPGYRIQCPDDAPPFALHEIQDTPLHHQNMDRNQTDGS